MRIALDGIPLLSPKTGIGKYTLELSNALRALPEDLDVRLFYGIHWMHRLRKRHPALNNLKNKRETTENRKKWQIYSFTKNVLKQYLAKAEAGIFRPHIFHATNYIAESFDVPMVVTVHDLAFVRYPETLPPERLKWLEQGLSKSLHCAAKIVAVSQFTKKEIVSTFNIKEDLIDVVYHGVDTAFKPMNYDVLESKLKAFDLYPDRYLLTVGTLEPRKNILNLIQAYESLYKNIRQKWPLVVVGMRGWKESAIYKKIESMADRGELKVLGYIEDDQLPFIYSGASIFVYPSLYEGFGFPPLEAMASGVPVIVSNRTSLPEVVGTNAYLVDPDDISSISTTILSLIESPDDRKRLGQNGLKWAQSFTWEKCAQETFAAYQKAL